MNKNVILCENKQKQKEIAKKYETGFIFHVGEIKKKERMQNIRLMSCCASVEFKNKFCVCIPFRKRMKMKTPKWNGVANWQINLHLSLDKFATFINIRWTFKWQPNVSHAMSVRYVREMVTKSRTGARCAQNHRTQIFLTHTRLLEYGMYGQMKWLRWREEKKLYQFWLFARRIVCLSKSNVIFA